MKDFLPYTSEQIRAVARFMFPDLGPDGTVGPHELAKAHLLLRRFARSGVTVAFPEPRYYITETAGGACGVWDGDGGQTRARLVAVFRNRDEADAYIAWRNDDHAAPLSEEVSA